MFCRIEVLLFEAVAGRHVRDHLQYRVQLFNQGDLSVKLCVSDETTHSLLSFVGVRVNHVQR